jgi:hypothetical protein
MMVQHNHHLAELRAHLDDLQIAENTLLIW